MRWPVTIRSKLIIAWCQMNEMTPEQAHYVGKMKEAKTVLNVLSNLRRAFPRVPAKVRSMSKRRQKIALVRIIDKDLQKFVGHPLSGLVKAEIQQVLASRFRCQIFLRVQLVGAIKSIDVSSVL